MSPGDRSPSTARPPFATRAPKLGLVGSLDGLRAIAVFEALKAGRVRVIRVADRGDEQPPHDQFADVVQRPRAALLAAQSKPIHDKFFTALADNLSPDQIEKVKDLMTYNKVKVTYDAYCQIISNLSDSEKAKVMDLLKAAREEAVDGGSAPEKSAIFQKYKEQINAYLDANGHDTAKTLKAWAEAHPNTNNPATK